MLFSNLLMIFFLLNEGCFYVIFQRLLEALLKWICKLYIAQKTQYMHLHKHNAEGKYHLHSSQDIAKPIISNVFQQIELIITLEYIYIRILSIYFEFFHALYLLNYTLWSFIFDNKVAMTVLVELLFDAVIEA